MDKRLKQMMLNGLFNEELEQAAIEEQMGESGNDEFVHPIPTKGLTVPFINRIKNFISEVDERAFLYLGGYINLPNIGDEIHAKVGGEVRDVIVDAVHLLEGYISVHYFELTTLYFKTAEQAAAFTSKGEKGSYSNWDNNESNTYQHKGVHLLEHSSNIGFDSL